MPSLMNYLKDGENYDRPVWLNAANATIFEPETMLLRARVYWRASFVGRVLDPLAARRPNGMDGPLDDAGRVNFQ